MHNNTDIQHAQRVSTLGIPVDALTLDSAADRIISIARSKPGLTQMVSTLNTDFLVNALGSRAEQPRHPELLEVLRSSDLVTADGFPIIWLSRLMGSPLPARVCGSDLVPELARRASWEGLSLFLFGGREGLAAAAAEKLQADNPGLQIAGTAAPMVHTEGEGLLSAEEDDLRTLETINASGADILLVGLGNPKQELWFERNRSRLRVKVAIGVGGTFEFITGGVRRAPRWMQRLNLEWLYRISQDPKRLWRRYALGLGKLAYLGAPIIGQRFREKLLFNKALRAGAIDPAWESLWSSREQSLTLLRLPEVVSRHYLQALLAQLSGNAHQTRLSLLDFSRVRHIELAGVHLLLPLLDLQRQQGSVQLLGINASLRKELAAVRLLDRVVQVQGDTLSNLGLGAETQGGSISCRSYALDSRSLIFLGGRLDREKLKCNGILATIDDITRDRDCVVDLRGVGLLQSSAIASLQELVAKRPGRILLSGLTPSIRQMFRVTGQDHRSEVLNDGQLLDLISQEIASHA